MRPLERLLDPADALLPRSRRRGVQRALQRLRARGLIETPVELLGGSRPARRVHRLTTAGRRAYAALDARFPVERLRPPTQGKVEHALLLADVATTIHAAMADATSGSQMVWETDWESVARIGSTILIPDALLTYAFGHRRVYAFIEADRANEYRAAFARKVGRYLQLYRSDTWREFLVVWPFVLTVTTTPGQAARLRRTTVRAMSRSAETPLMSRFRFTSLDELRGSLGFLGAIWQVAGREGRYPPIDPRDDDRGVSQVAAAQA